MSWLTHGLPYPQNVYPFEDQAGVSRTPFFMGYRGQEQRWRDSWRTYRLEFILGGDKLRELELWFWEVSSQGYEIGGQGGYHFNKIPLISESSLYPPADPNFPPEQYARPIEAPVITAIGLGSPSDSFYGYYRVTMTVETQYEGAPLATSQQLPT